MKEIKVMTEEEFSWFYNRLKKEAEDCGQDYNKRRIVIMGWLAAGAGTELETSFTRTQLKKCFDLGFMPERKEK